MGNTCCSSASSSATKHSVRGESSRCVTGPVASWKNEAAIRRSSIQNNVAREMPDEESHSMRFAISEVQETDDENPILPSSGSTSPSLQKHTSRKIVVESTAVLPLKDTRKTPRGLAGSIRSLFRREGSTKKVPPQRKFSDLLTPGTPSRSGPTVMTHMIEVSRDSDGHKQVNQYVLRQLLGRGSYGKVRMCEDKHTGDKFAVKIINKALLKRKRIGRMGTALDNVRKEIAIMKKLTHPHVVTLYEVLDDPSYDKLFLVMELVPGGPAMPSNNKAQPLPVAKARSYFRDLILGVEYLHTHANVVHRDIKPENLLVDCNGRVKVSDFGVSHVFDGVNDALKNTAGSHAFLSPEACGATQFSGKLVDIWAMGITLFYFIFGKVPFLAKAVPDLYDKIRTEEVVYPDLPERNLYDLISRCLIKNPNERITLEEIMTHPWVTNGGTEPLPACELCAKHKIVSITDDDVHRAVTNVYLMAKIKLRARKSLSIARSKIAQRNSFSSNSPHALASALSATMSAMRDEKSFGSFSHSEGGNDGEGDASLNVPLPMPRLQSQKTF
eukprot:GILJ01008568.1.p1 GENE.GILJ01008568.1~~GILJ01008568.1.p1  ORF type:complete len:556 (+),score=63.20 GILJ01008568.1:154-1821(+)